MEERSFINYPDSFQMAGNSFARESGKTKRERESESWGDEANFLYKELAFLYVLHFSLF